MNSMSSGIDEIFMQLSIEERPRCWLESLCHVHSVSDFIHFYPGRRKRKKKRKKRKRKHKDLNPPRSYPAFGVFVMLGFGATCAKAGSWADMMLRTEAKTSEPTGLKVVTILTSIQKFQFLSISFSLFRCGQATLRRTPRMPRK